MSFLPIQDNRDFDMTLPDAGMPNGGDDSAAIKRAFDGHQEALVRYAARLLGGDREKARDVVQDTYVRLLREPAGSVDGHVVEWLYTVCRRRAIDVLRKDGRLRHFGEGEEVRLADSGARPGRELEAEEAHDRLLTLIHRLPPNQQEVVRLKFQQGFSYKEISRITDLSVGNVGFLLHTAVQRLRREWKEAGE